MSYSRWSYSKWYSFWNCHSGTAKENQSLSLWLSKDQLFDWTYDELSQLTVSDIQEIYNCDLEIAEEGMMYIREFIEDVNYSFENSNDN